MTSSTPHIPSGSTTAQLSRRSFWIALLVVLAIFFLLHPPWKPLDASKMDANIFWSYVPIPFLVALLLALEHKWSGKAFALETLKLTLIKFAITFLFMNLVWTFAAPPAAAEQLPASAPTPAGESPAAESVIRFEPRSAPAPAPTPIDPASTGRLAGFVLGDDGQPRSGALVGVTSGLQGFVFAARPGLELAFSAAGPTPRALVVGPWDHLLLRGAPDQLHTARGVDEDGRTVFNVPLPPDTQRELMLDKPLGRVTVSCAVHGAAEPPAELAVTGTPFATFTDAAGHFDLPGVPAGDLVLSAWGPAHRRATLRVLLPPGGTADELRLQLR